MKAPIKLLHSIVVTALLSVSMISAYAATDYSVTLLGGESGYAISSNGWVTGTEGFSTIPTFFNETGMRVSSEPQPFLYGVGYAINKNGMALVGATENGEGYFFWQNGKFSLVPYSLGTPARINDAGQIAAVLPNGHVGLWSNGILTDLGTFPGGSANRIQAININGQIVGSAMTSAGARHAALWRAGVVINLGTLPGDSTSDAWNVNDAGDVVGFSYSSSTSRPFRWSNGVMTEIAPAGTFDIAFSSGSIFPVAMNNAGQIVGINTMSSVRHAFVWGNGVFTDLNPIVGSNSTAGCNADAINDAGQIVGRCGSNFVFKLTPAAPGTNLAVSMTAAPNPITQGGTLTYNLTVNNTGSLAATGVNLTDSLPTSASFKSVTSSQGSCSGTTAVFCALGNLASGASANVQIAVVPNLTGTLNNNVAVTGNEVDSDTSNNSATTNVTVNAPVAAADVGITMTGSAASIKRYGNLTYAIKVTNSGPNSASSVTLKDTLPSAMKFASATSSQGTCSGTTTVTCNLGTLTSGSNASVSIVVQARSRGTFTNAASVSSTTKDGNTTNNSASITTKVN